jgi:antitoxin ParD1/3/4
MPTMNISVSEEFVEFVDQEVASGEYSTASEVVRDALRLLQREKEGRQEKLAVLRREIAIGIEDIRVGRLSSRTAVDIAAHDTDDAGRRE